MKDSFQSRVKRLIQENEGPIDLQFIYESLSPQKEISVEFKRKVRRALYHLCQAGSVKRVEPAKYSIKNEI